jgi:phenylpropionate dioxygenase-like ring-hydroxylating dioxygenase large terminal subunit
VTNEKNFLLRDIWYYAVSGSRLKPGAMLPKKLLGEPILFGRAADGSVFALRDICPHRGIPLSCGWFDGKEVTCCYHGWRFDPKGRCTDIPSLVEGQDFDPARIKVKSYPCREVQGNIWIWMGDGEPPPEGSDLDIPGAPGFGDVGPQMCEAMLFPCFMDHAVIGLMDPAHGPYVHQSWYWRSEKSMHEKAKAFGPAPYGFQMRRHKPSKNSRAYKLVGGTPSTEITFRLPGVRIEHIQTETHSLVNLTAVTPLSETETVVNHCIYWTMPWLSVLKPVLRPYVRRFLGQDRDVVVMQQEGLKFDPSLMLIKDADTQARWYFRLKNEWQRSREENRPFENPVREVTLRWRS